jgi:hypothetical protein
MTAAVVVQRARPRMRKVSVARTLALTPRMRRITLAGEELDGFDRTGAAGHVRLWIPNAEGDLVYPNSTADGSPIAVERRSPTRVYTPSAVRVIRRASSVETCYRDRWSNNSICTRAATGSLARRITRTMTWVWTEHGLAEAPADQPAAGPGQAAGGTCSSQNRAISSRRANHTSPRCFA